MLGVFAQLQLGLVLTGCLIRRLSRLYRSPVSHVSSGHQSGSSREIFLSDSDYEAVAGTPPPPAPQADMLRQSIRVKSAV